MCYSLKLLVKVLVARVAHLQRSLQAVKPVARGHEVHVHGRLALELGELCDWYMGFSVAVQDDMTDKEDKPGSSDTSLNGFSTREEKKDEN